MTFAVVSVEAETGEKLELALPLDVPSRLLANKIMHDLGRPVRTGEAFDLYIQTGHADKRIPPETTLGQVGIQDGQKLRLKRRAAGSAPPVSAAYAFLQTQTGELLPLEANNVIIGRKDARYQIPLDLDLADYDPGHAVSRRHASIGRESGNTYLIDLRSTNGTRLNGETIPPGKKVPLKDGDSIEFGLGMRVTFITAQSAAAGK
jgi:hypothetical protein